MDPIFTFSRDGDGVLNLDIATGGPAPDAESDHDTDADGREVLDVYTDPTEAGLAAVDMLTRAMGWPTR